MEEIQNDAAKDYQTEFKQALEYYKGQNFDQGEAICRKLIDEFPDKVRCHYLLGHILMEVQRFQESVEQFLETVKKDVDEKICGDAYYWIGVIYGTSGWPEIGNAAYIYDSEKSKEYFRLAVDCRSYPAEALLQFKYEAKGQERIDLMEKGIKAFPERPEFYLLLSEHYGQHELFQLQLSALERAEQNGIQSLSLSYRLGCYYFKLQEFEQALLYFEKALSDLSGRGNYFPIKYYLGRIAEAFGDYDGAEAYYLQICAEQSADQDILFGVFGLITTYMLSDQKDKLYDFIQNLNLTKELFQVDGRIVGGPVFLIEHVVDDIGADNLDEVQEALSKLKPNRSSAILNGKIWLLQSCIAGLNSDYNEQYKAMRNALKSLPLYHYPFVADLYADSVLNLLSYEFKTKTDKDRFYQFLKADFDEKPALAESLAPYVHDIFDPFFSPSGYEKLISLSQYFNKKQLAEHDGLFRVAHSYAELNNNLKSEEYYSYYLEQCGDNTSVLNNLGNILDDKGDYAGAIALYERGLAIDPKHTNLNQNILISRKKLAAAEQKAVKEKALQREFMGAVSLLKTENDFVLDKLALFIDRAKKEANFNDWKLPVPKQNFQRLLSLTKDMANSLLDQWLRKQYLTDTGERDEYRVVIYSINPYLEEALKNLQKLKIPQPWLGGFMQITADGLENKGYFDLINRTELLGDKFRLIFQRDINELFFNYLMGHQKTTIVLAGSLVELALIFYCDKAGVATIAVTEGSKTKNKPLYSCVLIELITYVEQIKAFGKDFGHLTNLSRIYRNYVHPGKELGDAIDRTKADLCFMSTVEILKRTI